MPHASQTGLYEAVNVPSISPREWAAILFCGVWVLAAVVFFGAMGFMATLGGDYFLNIMLVACATFLPVGLILIQVLVSRSTRLLRAESMRLQGAVDDIRQTFTADMQSRQIGLQPSLEKRLDEISDAALNAENAVAVFQSRRTKPQTDQPAPAEVMDDTDQPALGLNLADETPSTLSAADMIVALNFPETADDKAGFAILRRALSDRKISRAVTCAQDILTLFSEDGIYMDDMRPDRARPDLWRRFADGERGAIITALGGIRDKSSLALTAGRMRQDANFREKAHDFLRQFDKTLQTAAHDMTDAQLAAFTNTRSARAFMLLGRVVGIFD